MITFSEAYLKDKIYACWVGKNIGGTLGTPYEGTREYLDIDGFASREGEPLPNDDLDLQLIWLKAMNEMGPEQVNSKILGEYWLSWINPNWNEYGEGKANMRDGLLPPMSGEFNNDGWKHSNGAWIRTEVWACLYPGLPEKAIRYAFEDACVDHGFGEGTFAAIFIAAMESAAFIISDARKLLEIGLGKIPEDCRVARAVRLVMKCFDTGVSRRECRDRIVEDSADLGWFQAPANVAYVVLGLLYGKGDYKKSLIYAIDCGDDTDCTGATLGSLMGIMGGMDVIPEDWRAYIGDGIRSICLTNGHGKFPENNVQLTDCIFNLLPVTLRMDQKVILNNTTDGDWVKIGDKNDFSALQKDAFMGRDFVDSLSARKPYSYVIEGLFADALVEFDGKPALQPLGTLAGRVTLQQKELVPSQNHYHLKWFLPEGWTVDCPRNLYSHYASHTYLQKENSATFAIHAGDKVEPGNDLVLQITVPGRLLPILVPVHILG